MRLVTINELQPDMTLAKTIFVNGNAYINQGATGLDQLKSKFDRLGISCVYVEDEVSEDVEITDAVTDKTRVRCKDALRTSFKHVQENMTIDIDAIEAPLNALLDDVIANKDVQLNLTDINAVDDYTFGHSVSTAVYAVMIGIDQGYSREKLRDLGMGAILHDVGKLLIDPIILHKEGKLTEEEFKQVKKHPEFSYSILQKCDSLSEDSRLIAYQHHERMNGTGYPKRLKGYQISAFGRIAAIADVYDALSADRCYRRKWPNNQILDHLTKTAGTEFDAEMVASLLKRIAVYPNGSEVLMSDGTRGLVVRQNEQMPLRPVVRIFKDADGKICPFKLIDMMEQLSITIVASQLELQRADETSSNYHSIVRFE